MPVYQVMIDDVVSSKSYSFDDLINSGFLDDYDVSIKIRATNETIWQIAREYPFHLSESNINDKNYAINENSYVKRKILYMTNYSLNEDGSINRSGNYHRPRKPDNNMIWAIISISICLPFGILALVESVKVDSLYSDGNINGAIRASENAKKWAMWSIYAWIGLIAIIFIATIAGS